MPGTAITAITALKTAPRPRNRSRAGPADSDLPIPYPASCRPQAWSAASAGALVSASLGLSADAPRGRLCLEPLRPAPFGDLRVRGLWVRGEPVEVDDDGTVREVRAPDWLAVEVR